jgi:hypothetical protein
MTRGFLDILQRGEELGLTNDEIDLLYEAFKEPATAMGLGVQTEGRLFRSRALTTTPGRQAVGSPASDPQLADATARQAVQDVLSGRESFNAVSQDPNLGATVVQSVLAAKPADMTTAAFIDQLEQRHQSLMSAAERVTQTEEAEAAAQEVATDTVASAFARNLPQGGANPEQQIISYAETASELFGEEFASILDRIVRVEDGRLSIQIGTGSQLTRAKARQDMYSLFGNNRQARSLVDEIFNATVRYSRARNENDKFQVAQEIRAALEGLARIRGTDE